MYLGIEIGGTKLQLALGLVEGQLLQTWRGTVVPAEGGPGILKQFSQAIPELLKQVGLTKRDLRGIGVGFGGPTDDRTQSVIKSHHIHGWDGFPLGEWLREETGVPAVICNDADVAGLAEAELGAGRGFDPVFYVTVGSGIGGGLILGGEIYRGQGKGAAEIGHVRPAFPVNHPKRGGILEAFASGWSLDARPLEMEKEGIDISSIRRTAGERPITAKVIAEAARQGDGVANQILNEAIEALADGINTIIKLLCPQRIVIGGGVALLGDDLFFEPLRRKVLENQFEAFAGLTKIVPAALGEEVVLHGALALARRRFE